MKALMLAAFFVSCAGFNADAQGQVQFNNRVSGELVSPIFSPQIATPNVSTRGQPTNGVPAGTVTYTGSGLQGNGFTAQLWSGTNGAPASSLSPILDPLATTTFRTGGFAGFINATVPTIPGTLPGQTVSLQVRVWDNRGGLITSWGQVALIGTASGVSDIFSYTLGGGTITPPPLSGFQSFSITGVVPEPSVTVLILMGACVSLARKRITSRL